MAFAVRCWSVEADNTLFRGLAKVGFVNLSGSKESLSCDGATYTLGGERLLCDCCWIWETGLLSPERLSRIEAYSENLIIIIYYQIKN